MIAKRARILVFAFVCNMWLVGKAAAQTAPAANGGEATMSPVFIWTFVGFIALAVVGFVMSRVKAASHKQQVQELMEEIDESDTDRLL